MAFYQSRTLWVNQLADGVAELVLDRPDARVNLLDTATLDDLDEAMDRMVAFGQFEVLILRSAKPASFCHGLDFDLLASLHTSDEFAKLARRGQELCARIAGLRLPSVALIAGPCLGAGLELVLACDLRVVLDRPGVQLGLTQLDLGLIPAWGATQRLPRLIGVERGLQFLLGGRRLSARQSVAWGLADELSDEEVGQLPQSIAQARKRQRLRFTYRSWRQRLLESTSLGCRALFRGAERVLRERLPEGMPAPWEALAALRASVLDGASLSYEQQAFARLGTGSAFQHMLSFQLWRARQRERRAELAAEEHPHQVAIVGTTAQSLAVVYQAVTAGQQVVMRAANEQLLGASLLSLVKRLETEARQGSLSSTELFKCLSAVRGTYTWTNFEAVELALVMATDSVPELVSHLATHAPPLALLAWPALGGSVGELQRGVADPGRTAGVTFIDPVGRGSVVEVVRAPATRPQTERRLTAWVASLGYTPISVADRPGGLVLRVLLPALNEALLLVRQGMSLARVDAALKRFGFSHGPFEYLDLVGLDVAAQLVSSLQPIFMGRVRFETGFARMAEEGWLGTRTELGFYHYAAGKRRIVHAEAEELLRSQQEPAQPLPALSVRDQIMLVQERVVTLAVLEAARCREEEVVGDDETLDMALCSTIWPPHRGGPLRYARERANFVGMTQTLAEQQGPRFEMPTTLLPRLSCGRAVP
jgi:3-hydroxyacyl-CoA dehydrogenase / enoyl-CoA hydratase / 3-hydroxybutyryl-CoA epimerase